MERVIALPERGTFMPRPKITKVVGIPSAERITFSPDGKLVYITGHVKRVRVFNRAKNRVVTSIELDAEGQDGLYVWPPLFSRDQTTAVIRFCLGLGTHHVTIWDQNPLRMRHKISARRFGSGFWPGILLSPDGSRLVTTSQDYAVRIWDVLTGKKLASRRTKKQCVTSAAFSPDGNFLVWACEYGYLTVLDFRSHEEKYSFRACKEDIHFLSFTADGRYLVVPCGEKGLKFFEAETGIENLILPSACCWLHKISPTGDLVLCTHRVSKEEPWKMALHLWDLRHKRCVATLPAKEGTDTVTFAFSPDGKYVAISYDGDFAFSPDGQVVAVLNKKLKLWKVDDLMKKGVDCSQFVDKKIPKVVTSSDMRTGAERQAEQSVKLAKPVGSVKGMPFPAHLTKCLARVQSKCSGTKCFGHVQCSCGNRNLKLSTTDAFFKEGGKKRPMTVSRNGKYYFLINASCPNCGSDHLLFDSNQHGWNAVCVPSTRSGDSPSLASWQCQKCGMAEHRASVGIVGEPMQVAIDESGELLDETNWQEGFGAINIAIECCGCRQKVTDWVNYETM